MPALSVLLPCHNCAQTLPAALDSLMEQTFSDFEILAVNNGSTDATGRILHSYALSEPRLRVFTLEQAGIVPALNHGLQLARGECIAREVPTPVLIWRDDPNRLSRRDPRCFVAAMYELKSSYLARWLQDNNPHHPRVVILGAGRESRKRTARLEWEGIQVTAYADIHPGRIGQKINGQPVISVHDLPPPGRCFCLSYVGQRGMRTQVSAFMQNQGYVLGRDFLLAA